MATHQLNSLIDCLIAGIWVRHPDLKNTMYILSKRKTWHALALLRNALISHTSTSGMRLANEFQVGCFRIFRRFLSISTTHPSLEPAMSGHGECSGRFRSLSQGSKVFLSSPCLYSSRFGDRKKVVVHNCSFFVATTFHCVHVWEIRILNSHALPLWLCQLGKQGLSKLAWECTVLSVSYSSDLLHSPASRQGNPPNWNMYDSCARVHVPTAVKICETYIVKHMPAPENDGQKAGR